MEFSASNVDFSSLSPRFKQASERERQRGVPSIKVVILLLLTRLALADRHRLVAYRNCNWWQAFNGSTLMALNDLEPQNRGFSDFFAIFVNCNEMDGDRPGQPANRNCYGLSRVSWALLKLLVKLPCKWQMFSTSYHGVLCGHPSPRPANTLTRPAELEQPADMPPPECLLGLYPIATTHFLFCWGQGC